MTEDFSHMQHTTRRHSRFMRIRQVLAYVTLACAASACASTRTCYEPGTPANALHTIYVVQRGWHTGVAIRTADWPNESWSLLREFPNATYLEFGWGDERFYQANENTIWLGLRAALWPTTSVIHVIGIGTPAAAEIQANTIVAVRVSADGLRALTTGIEREFKGEPPIASGPQINWAPAPNRFYRAKRSFYFPRMCNWWTARRLHDAGCPIQPWTIVTSSRVMRETYGFLANETQR